MTCTVTTNPACRLATLALFICIFPSHAAADHPLCFACHGTDGMGYGNFSIPIIAGIPAAHIEEALYAYKDGARRCNHAPLMCETASAISDEEVAEVADYFGGQERVSSEQSYAADKAAAGKLVHERLCEGCHVPPDDPDVADALGISLHGQRGWYLRYALESYMDGSRENLLPAMADKLSKLKEGDVENLIHYYTSY